MIYIFILTLILLCIIQSRESTELCCWVYQYIFYIFIYTAIPYFYIFYTNEIVNVSLPNLNESTVTKLVNFSTITNAIILIVLLTMKKEKRRTLLNPPEIRLISNLPAFLFYILIPFSIIMSMAYPWGGFGDVRTIGHSVASYLKFTVSLLFILQAAVYRQTRRSAWIFNFSLLLMFILFICDTARTTFFVCLVSASYGYRFTFKSVAKNFIILISIFIIFVYITLARSGIEFKFDYLLWPFFAEGIFGSYSALNALSINDYFGFQTRSALLFFVDQFMLIIPSPILNLSGYQFNFVNVLNEASTAGLVDGKLSPLGGFFAFADMILAFGWFGTVIFSIIMFTYLSIIHKAPKIIGLYLFIFYFVLLKSPLFVIFNLTVTAVIVLGVYNILLNILPKVNR